MLFNLNSYNSVQTCMFINDNDDWNFSTFLDQKVFQPFRGSLWGSPLGVLWSAKFTHFNLIEGWLITVESVHFVSNTHFITE